MRRIIEREDGKIFPVINLYDHKGRETFDLVEASSFVARLDEDEFLAGDCDEITVRTVH